MEKKLNYHVYKVVGFELRFIASFEDLCHASLFEDYMNKLYPDSHYHILNS